MIFKAIFVLLLTVFCSGILAEKGPDQQDDQQEFTTSKPDNGPTGTDLGNITKLDMKAEITTIPEEDIREALNLDYGRYTPMHFQYHNEQNTFLKNEDTDHCANQWVKCLVSLTNVHVICVTHEHGEAESRGVTVYENYCDMFYDNCRYETRYWRIVETFSCYHENTDKYMHYYYPRRTLNNIWDYFNPLG